ncbi:MAG: Gfo/Idh/MocA family oxidoreductase, partial [Pseudomonadota bacterium]
MHTAALGADRVLMEAYHYRFHPLFERILKVVRDEELGSLQHIEAWFNVPIAHSSGEFRYRKELGGGALMDLGCYPLHWTRVIAGREPRVRSATAQWHFSGVDLAMEASLDFGGGLSAAIRASMSSGLPEGLDAELHVHGSSASLRADNPLDHFEKMAHLVVVGGFVSRTRNTAISAGADREPMPQMGSERVVRPETRAAPVNVQLCVQAFRK